MDILTSQIESALSLMLFIISRISGVIISTPFIGTKILNAKTKVILALLLSWAIFPNVTNYSKIDLLTLEAALTVISQIIIGLALGITISIAFQIFIMVGEIVAMQMGLSMAVMTDPTSGYSVPVLSEIYYIMLILLFFTLDGHLHLITIASKSFEVIPIGRNIFEVESFKQIAMLANWMYVNAFKIALPMITALLIVQLCLGVMTKASPQLNIFSIGFPITMIIGIFFVFLNINSVSYHFVRIFDYATEWVTSEIYAMEDIND